MEYYSPDSEASSSPEQYSWTSEHMWTPESSATMELSGQTHSNGYDLQEVEDGVFIVSGGELAPTRIPSWTADQIRKEWPNGQLFRHYVSRRYSNARGYEYVKDTSLGLLEVDVGAYIQRTLKVIQNEFLYFQALWAASEAMVLLKNRVSAIARNRPISKVVGFAIGSFQDIVLANRHRSQLQLAALFTVLECLEDNRDASLSDIRCFMQDPMLTELDVEFLNTLGIEAVNDPEAFLAVDETTLVYAPCAYDFVYRKLSQSTWPAALICDSLQATIAATVRNRVDFGQDMFGAYEQAPFPDFLDDMDGWLQPFGTMAVYWRKPYITTTLTTIMPTTSIPTASTPTPIKSTTVTPTSTTPTAITPTTVTLTTTTLTAITPATTTATKKKVITAPPARAAPSKRGRPRKEQGPADGRARIGAAKIETPQTRAPGQDYGYIVPAGRKDFRERQMPWVRPVAVAGRNRKVRDGRSTDGGGGRLIGVRSGKVRA
ncbi:MAG: hypothetical protein Q9208_005425 [Pyrenodesmia sp. 3 TL-2023]